MSNSKILKNKNVVIAGGSGFLGTSLANRLFEMGASVTVMARNPGVASENGSAVVSQVAWDGIQLGEWQAALDGCDGLINLAGRSVDCIKSPDHCDEILRSRVESTKILGVAMRKVDNPPPVWVQMSTAHIYGDPPTEFCSESSAVGAGFAPMVGNTWENTFWDAALPSQRKVILRTSFVVGRDRGAGCGALERLTWIAKLGLGGRVGSGKQGFSWIHEEDLNQVIIRALVDSNFHGVYNATSPNPVSQMEFMKALRAALGVPIGLPASEWMVRFGAHFILRTDPELALYGRYVVPERLLNEEFEFRFPRLPEALLEVFSG